jgi:sugar lactone lactonase YvrE
MENGKNMLPKVMEMKSKMQMKQRLSLFLIMGTIIASIFLVGNISQKNYFNSDFIDSSPKNNMIYSPAVTKWGTWGSMINELNSPYAMTISASELIYVCDTQNHRIKVYDLSGNVILSWGSFGTQNGKFDTPSGIAINNKENFVYVADTKNKRIQIFEATTGNYIDQFTILGEPEGIAVDSVGNVFVADRTFNWIRKFDSYGTNEIMHWGNALGNPSPAIGEFDKPSSIAIDNMDNVYVCDKYNNRIQKFNNTGSFILSFGSHGSEPGQLQDPTGIYIFLNNWVYVADSWGNRIQIFNTNGIFIDYWGTSGSGIGSLNYPTSVVLDIEGNAYVLDSQNHRIQKFIPHEGLKLYPSDMAIGTDNNLFYLNPQNGKVLNYGNDDLGIKSVLGGFGTGNKKFQNPVAIDINSTNDIFILDSTTAQIKVFTSTGTYIKTLGGSRIYWGKALSKPQDFLVLNSGNLLILDTANHRLIEIDQNGELVDVYGSYGNTNGSFIQPLRITQDWQYIFILDSTGRIQQFYTNFTFVRSFGSFGMDLAQYLYPMNMVSNATDLFIINTLGHEIMRFSAITGNFIESWGSEGSLIGQLSYPSAAGFNTNGDLIVADTQNFRFQSFNGMGNAEIMMKFSGSQNSLWSLPYDAALNSLTGHIVVTDNKANCIRYYNQNGDELRALGTSGNGTLQFSHPKGIFIDGTTNRTFIADSGNNRIVVLLNDNVVKEISNGTWGDLIQPGDVAVNSTGSIYITDSGNNRVIVLNATYDYEFEFTGNFSYPLGITIDSNNRVFIVDRNNHVVKKFTSNGTLLMQFGTYGADIGEFAFPEFLTVNQAGEIFIPDTKNSRVQYFYPNGSFINYYGQYGITNGQFRFPTGICLLSESIMMICDTGNDRLQKVDKTEFLQFTAPILSQTASPDEDGNFTISWSEVVSAEIYYIYRSTTDHITDVTIRYLEPIANTSGTSFDEINLPNGVYYYAIVAGNLERNSTVSNSIQVIVAIPSSPPIDNKGSIWDWMVYIIIGGAVGILLIAIILPRVMWKSKYENLKFKVKKD